MDTAKETGYSPRERAMITAGMLAAGALTAVWIASNIGSPVGEWPTFNDNSMVGPV